MTIVKDVWSVQVIDDTDTADVALDADFIRRIMAEAEENMTDLLPDGYRAEIRRWNEWDGLTEEDDDDD